GRTKFPGLTHARRRRCCAQRTGDNWGSFRAVSSVVVVAHAGRAAVSRPGAIHRVGTDAIRRTPWRRQGCGCIVSAAVSLGLVLLASHWLASAVAGTDRPDCGPWRNQPKGGRV